MNEQTHDRLKTWNTDQRDGYARVSFSIFLLFVVLAGTAWYFDAPHVLQTWW